jgi:hypothetical protein
MNRMPERETDDQGNMEQFVRHKMDQVVRHKMDQVVRHKMDQMTF